MSGWAEVIHAKAAVEAACDRDRAAACRGQGYPPYAVVLRSEGGQWRASAGEVKGEGGSVADGRGDDVATLLPDGDTPHLLPLPGFPVPVPSELGAHLLVSV